MSESSPGAACAPDGPIHEIIWGPNRSGKIHTARARLGEEHTSPLVESWVMDPVGALPEWRGTAERYARSLVEIGALLTAVAQQEALGRSERLVSLNRTRWIPDDAQRGLPLLSITVDKAELVLTDPACRGAVAETLFMAYKCGIRFRVVMPGLLLDSFGYSEVIHSTLTQGTVLACQPAKTSQVRPE